MQLLLVRHGETNWNAEIRFQGHADPPLNASGEAQIRSLAERLKGCPIDVAYASDLQRAHESARIIVCQREIPHCCDSRLRERSFGKWEGLTRQEVGREYPDSYEQWKQYPARHVPPDGESLEDLHIRVNAFLRFLVVHHGCGNVLIVAHGGSLRGLVCAALGAPVSSHRSMRVNNGSLSILAHGNQGFQLLRLNDTSHLRNGQGISQLGST